MRLANSVLAADGSAEYGRLEVFHSGGWGTVCANAFFIRLLSGVTFGAGSADVACRQLGYRQGFQIQRLVWFFPGGRRWHWSVLTSLRIPAWSWWLIRQHSGSVNSFCPGATARPCSCFANVRPCPQGHCSRCRCPPVSGVMFDSFVVTFLITSNIMDTANVST